MNNDKRGFQEQYIRCSEEGLTKKTRFFPFDENPELLPMFNKKMIDAIKRGEFKGIDRILCGKYGGYCSSANPSCRILRGID